MANLIRADLGEYLYLPLRIHYLAAKIMVDGFDIYICIFEGHFNIII